MSPRRDWIRRLAAVGGLAVLAGCTGVAQIRIENASTVDYSAVSIAGQSFGDIGAGATTEYRPVRLRFRYATIRLTADGHRVTGQTLNFGSDKLTHRIDIIDLAAGHLAIDILRD